VSFGRLGSVGLGFGRLGASNAGAGFDYYVDSSRANDTGDGLTAATAKKTIAAAQALLSAGKRLGLAKGSSWREQLTISNTGVTVGAYGSGADPILDASNIVLNASFTKTGGLTNVYQFDVTPTTAGGNGTFSVFEDDQRLKRVASAAACDAAPGSFYAADTPTDATPSTILVHPIGSSNAISDGKVYEVTARDSAILSSATGTVVSGIYGKRCIALGGVFQFQATGATVSDCTVEDGQKHNIFIEDASTVTNVISTKMEGIDSHFIYHVDTVTGGTVGSSFVNCTATGEYAYGEESTAYATCSGFFCHAGSGTIPLMNVTNATISNVAAGVSAETSVLNVSGAKTTEVSTAVSAGSGVTANVTNGFFDQRSADAYKKASNAQRAMFGCEGGTLNVSGCVVVFSASAFGAALFSNGASSNVNFTNNTIVDESGSASFVVLYKNASGTATFSENVVYGIRNISLADVSFASTLVANNNDYYITSSDLTWQQGVTTYTGLAAWQATGQDAASLNVDPSFTNAISGWTQRSHAILGNATLNSNGWGALN
jgi:hypothetical protein